MGLFGFSRHNIAKLEQRGDLAGLIAARRDAAGPEVRREAVGAIANLVSRQPDPAASECLCDALGDADSEIRARAAAALVHLPSRTATAALVELIERDGESRDAADPRPGLPVLDAAVDTLGASGDPEAAQALLKLLSRVPRIRQATGFPAAFQLVMGDQLALRIALNLRKFPIRTAIESSYSFLDWMQARLDSPDTDADRARCLPALVERFGRDEEKDLAALPWSLLSQIVSSQVAPLRAACARELRRRPLDGEGAGLLVALAADDDSAVRQVAEAQLLDIIAAAGGWRPLEPGLEGVLAAAAGSSNSRVRAAAEQNLEIVRSRLAEQEEERRREAAKPDFQKAIERLLADRSAASVRQAIGIATSQLDELDTGLVWSLVGLFQEVAANTCYKPPSDWYVTRMSHPETGRIVDRFETWRPIRPEATELIRRLAANPRYHETLRSFADQAHREIRSETDTAYEHEQNTAWAQTAKLIDSLVPAPPPAAPESVSPQRT